METQFQNLADLARLPWFGLVDGRLVLKDNSVGPVLDMHSHLALAYVRPMKLDLQKSSEWTEHYLPACCPLHMDVYVNDNFSKEQLGAMKRDLTLGSLTSSGMRATHTVPNLAREMREMGITHSVILPIDFPVLSHNTETALHAITGHKEFIGFCSVHPYARDVEAKLDAFKAMGAVGIKVHPAVQTFRPDTRRAIELYRACARRGLPVLWHCGPVGIEPRLQRYLTQVRHYEKPIRECPETTFILGHAGARQADMALELLKKYPNVWMEISSQAVGSIQMLLKNGDSHRIMYGTDWPFYHQGIALAKVLMATDGDEELRHRVLFRNAAQLLGIEKGGS